MVKLYDGSVYPLSDVEQPLAKIRRLMRYDSLCVMALYLLQQKAQGNEIHAQNADHKLLIDRVQLVLQNGGLMTADGTISDLVRSVALSSIKFNHEIPQVRVNDPIVKEH